MEYLFSFSRSPGGAVRRSAWRPAGRTRLGGPRSVLCAAVAVAAASGCETLTVPEVEDTAIVTAGSRFQLHSWVDDRGRTAYGAKIPYSYTNRTGSNVYVDFGCNDGRHHHLEMEDGEDGSGEWVFFYGGVVCLIGDFFTAIGPDEVRQHMVVLANCTSDDSCGERLSLPGIASTRFRIVWWAWSSLDEDERGHPIGRDLVPLEERISNPFTFELVETSH